MERNQPLNLSMLFDFYEMTMANGYFRQGMQERITYFDVFFRRVPDGGGFAIAAGLEQLVDYIRDLHFDEEDIAYLRGKNLFQEDFLDYLRNFQFTGDIWAVPEGTPVFPGEPLVTVRAPASQAQLIETYALLAINHQSLIATKANRVVRAAQGRTVLEFGSRRAQGADGALLGAGPPTSAASTARPAPSATSSTASPPPGPWPTPGSRCSTPSTRPSGPTARSTPPTPCCWWTPTTP